MAFSSVSTGSGGTSKSWFAWSGWRAVTYYTIPENASYVSPDTGNQPCLTESVTIWASGGSQRIILAGNLSGTSYVVYSGSFNPGGGADTTSTRDQVNKTITRAITAGGSEYVGLQCDSTSGVGFLTNSPGTTYLEKSDWANDSTWSSNLRSIVYYNTIPGAPTLNTAVDSLTFGAVDLSWTAGTTGGSAINGYRIEWSTVSNFATIAGSIADTGSTVTTRTVTGLTSGTLYYFRVAALNAVSDAFSGQPASIRSNVVSATPTSYGKRRTSSAWTPIVSAKRYDQAQGKWVTLTSAKRYNAATGQWVNIV